MAKRNPITIPMVKDKDCKGSVKYRTTDPMALLTGVYVSRAWQDPMPSEITITLE